MRYGSIQTLRQGLTAQGFSGPISESVPSSVTGFAHRRGRTDSISSFTYFQEADEPPKWPAEQAVVDDSDDEDADPDDGNIDLEAGRRSAPRKVSDMSDYSAQEPLLDAADSNPLDTRPFHGGGNFSQKLHIVSEDLTVVVAGFTTKRVGFISYVALCVCTLGLGYLVLRWLPRWRIRLIGRPNPLRSCSWVVIEVRHRPGKARAYKSADSRQNQWGEFTLHQVQSDSYGFQLSTVFNTTTKEILSVYPEDDDPTLDSLRSLNYRYLRLLYHPIEDKFVLNSDWTDPEWTNIQSLRSGLDSEERDMRELVFGRNNLDIEEKTVPQLLMDEVCDRPHINSMLITSGLPSLLYFSAWQSCALESGRVLLLCQRHLSHFHF